MKEPTTGSMGEELASEYLKNKGFSIVSTNFSRKWGEIDIIALKDGVLHFVEVKSVSCEITGSSKEEISRVTQRYHPEERVHPEKSKRIFRTIQSYLGDREEDWLFCVAAVFLDLKRRRAYVRFLGNVTLQ